MTFRQMRLSLQLLAEERIGAPRYWRAVEERARQDAGFEAAKRAAVDRAR